jgi:hypothetical protein
MIAKEYILTSSDNTMEQQEGLSNVHPIKLEQVIPPMRYTQLLDLLMENQMMGDQKRSGKMLMMQRTSMQKICKSFLSSSLLNMTHIFTTNWSVSQSMPVHLALLLFITPSIKLSLKYERQGIFQRDSVVFQMNGMMTSILCMKLFSQDAKEPKSFIFPYLILFGDLGQSSGVRNLMLWSGFWSLLTPVLNPIVTQIVILPIPTLIVNHNQNI